MKVNCQKTDRNIVNIWQNKFCKNSKNDIEIFKFMNIFWTVTLYDLQMVRLRVDQTPQINFLNIDGVRLCKQAFVT